MWLRTLVSQRPSPQPARSRGAAGTNGHLQLVHVIGSRRWQPPAQSRGHTSCGRGASVGHVAARQAAAAMSRKRQRPPGDYSPGLVCVTSTSAACGVGAGAGAGAGADGAGAGVQSTAAPLWNTRSNKMVRTSYYCGHSGNGVVSKQADGLAWDVGPSGPLCDPSTAPSCPDMFDVDMCCAADVPGLPQAMSLSQPSVSAMPAPRAPTAPQAWHGAFPSVPEPPPPAVRVRVRTMAGRTLRIELPPGDSSLDALLEAIAVVSGGFVRVSVYHVVVLTARVQWWLAAIRAFKARHPPCAAGEVSGEPARGCGWQQVLHGDERWGATGCCSGVPCAGAVDAHM